MSTDEPLFAKMSGAPSIFTAGTEIKDSFPSGNYRQTNNNCTAGGQTVKYIYAVQQGLVCRHLFKAKVIL